MSNLRRTNLWLDKKSTKQLTRIAKAQGLKTAQLIRIAILQFVERQS